MTTAWHGLPSPFPHATSVQNVLMSKNIKKTRSARVVHFQRPSVATLLRTTDEMNQGLALREACDAIPAHVLWPSVGADRALANIIKAVGDKYLNTANAYRWL